MLEKSFKNGDSLHVVLYGTFKESKYFLGDFRDCFDLIGFNANLVAYAPGGIAAFISRLKNKRYFIDPQFHAFQHPIETLMVKRNKDFVLKDSVRKLADRYGSYVSDFVGEKPICPEQISAEIELDLCEKVLSFQYNIVHEALKDSDYNEFLEDLHDDLLPCLLIAPYFYIEYDGFNEEVKKNISFVENSKKTINSFNWDSPLYAEIVISKEILNNKECLDELIKAYGTSSADGFLVWVDDFSEVECESERVLKNYYDLFDGLSVFNRPIINLHGSYFSVMLSGKAKSVIAGVGHGIEYGESRKVVPVGGGVPLSKFYYPKYYKRINYDPDASNILLEEDIFSSVKRYFNEVCDCQMCKKVMEADNVIYGFQQYGETDISKRNGKAYPTADAMDKSRRHYMYNKQKEYSFVRMAMAEDLSKILDKSTGDALRVRKVHSFEHLRKWRRVLFP